MKPKKEERKAPIVVIDQKKVDEHDKKEFMEIVRRHLPTTSNGIGMVYASNEMPNPPSDENVE